MFLLLYYGYTLYYEHSFSSPDANPPISSQTSKNKPRQSINAPFPELPPEKFLIVGISFARTRMELARPPRTIVANDSTEMVKPTTF